MDSTAFAIVVIIFGLLTTVIGFLIKDKLNSLKDNHKSLDKRVETIETELKAIRTNYLDRFEQVKDHVTNKFDELKDCINSIKLTIAKGE